MLALSTELSNQYSVDCKDAKTPAQEYVQSKAQHKQHLDAATPLYAIWKHGCNTPLDYKCKRGKTSEATRVILNRGAIVVGVHLTEDLANFGDRNVFVDPLQDTLQFGNGDPDGEMQRAWRSSTSLKQHRQLITDVSKRQKQNQLLWNSSNIIKTRV